MHSALCGREEEHDLLVGTMRGPGATRPPEKNSPLPPRGRAPRGSVRGEAAAAAAMDAAVGKQGEEGSIAALFSRELINENNTEGARHAIPHETRSQWTKPVNE